MAIILQKAQKISQSMLKALFISILVMLSLSLEVNVFANNVNITNVQRLAAPNRNKVRFDLSWQNSWMVTGLPGNHDAVWVFIKYRACTAPASNQWEHARLSTTMANHTLDPGLAFAQNIVTTDRLGGAGSHNTGAMIRRATVGTGHIVSLPCTLHVDNATSGASFDPAIDYDIRVIGIEMVQIVGGANFVVGDISATARAQINAPPTCTYQYFGFDLTTNTVNNFTQQYSPYQ